MTKVLVVTYYWPPAGGPGVQRWLNFVKYLPEFNIEPIVFIPENPHYPITDGSLQAQVPDGLSCYKHPIREPYFLANFFLGKKTRTMSSGIIKEGNQTLLERMALWIRGNCYIPDARRSWIRPASNRISDILQKEKIDTIVTTGPPHSVHLIGLRLKQKNNIRWVADFRDPWTSIGYHAKLKLTQSSKRKHAELEKKVLQNADRIITTSQTTKAEFLKSTSRPIAVVTNGYSTDLSEEKVTPDAKFSFSYIGSLLSGRNPSNLWKTISELVQEHPGFRQNFQLKLIGVVGQEVLDTIEEFQLGSYTTIVPYVDHKEARKYQKKSRILLLLEINRPEIKGILPGKLFEYMEAGRPILAIGPEDWEAGDMVQETNTGAYFGYRNSTDLKEQILAWYKQYENDTLEVKPVSIEAYHRKALTEKLAKELTWA